MSWNSLKNILGFGLNGVGISWALFDKSFCGLFCKGVCTEIQKTECSFLFLFVAILLIVCGYAIIKNRSKKNKLKRFLKIK